MKESVLRDEVKLELSIKVQSKNTQNLTQRNPIKFCVNIHPIKHPPVRQAELSFPPLSAVLPEVSPVMRAPA